MNAFEHLERQLSAAVAARTLDPALPDRPPRRRGRAAARTLTLALAPLLGTAGLGTAAFVARGGIDSEIAALEAREGAATPHLMVGSGSTPGNGRYEIYRSSTADGRECFGLKLFNQPAAPHGTLFEGCGNPWQISVASNSGHGETIIYGRLPAATARMVVTVPGQSPRSVTVQPALAVVPYRYALLAYPGQLRAAHAEARDAEDRLLARQAVPLPDSPATE